MASPDGIKSFLKKAAEIKGIEYTEDDANALIRSYDYDYGKLVNALGKSTGITDDGIEDFRKSAYEKFKIVDLDENHRQELKLQDSPLEIDDPDGYKKYDYLKTQYNYTNYLMGELDKKKPQAVKQDETKAFQAQFAVEGVQPQMPESFTTNELPLDTYAQRRQTLEQRKKALGDLVDKQAKDNKDKLGYISKEALYYRDQEKSIDQQIKNLEEKISKSGTPQIVGDQMIRVPDNRLKAELRTLKNIKTQIKNIYIALEAPAGSSVKSQLSGLYNGLFNSAPMEDFVTLGFNEAARNLDIIRTAKDYQRELSFLYTTTQNSGLRADGTPKGIGWLGEIKLPNGGVATEYSIGVEMDGQDFEIPTLVPTLSEEEINLMVNDIIPNDKPIPESIVQKSIDHANQRISQGLSPFISNEEAAFNALKPEDAALLKTYQLMTAIKSENPGNFFYKAGEGVQDMLPFIVEFAATGGIGAGAKKIATKGVDAMMKAMVKKYATREATTLAAKTAGTMAKAAAQSLVMPSTIKGTIEKQLPNINEQGNLEAGLDPTKAFFNTWVEMMAEVIGEDVADIAKVAYRNSIIKDLAKNPGKAREIYLKTMNFISSDAGIPSVQGMPFELLGEQITGALQAVQNDDYSFYTPEQQLHLLAVVAIAGGSSSILSVPQRIQTRMSFQDASKKLEDNPDQRFTDAVKNIVINYNDVNEGMKAYLDMQKNFRGSLTVEQYKTGLDYLYKAYRYNQISVTRSAEIQRGIAEFGDNSGNLSTAVVDGETLYIRNPELAYNPQNPETYNNILYTRTADGTVKPMQAGKVGAITTQSFDDVSAVTEQEMKIKEERYLKAEQAKKDAASKNITPGREVKTPDGKASVSNINETGITVTNAKGESFVYSLDQVEAILTEKEKEQQKAEHEALHKGIAPEATVLLDQSEDITNNRVLRVVDFSNGQSKIFVDGKETIVNSEKDKEQILQEIYSQEIQSLSLELQNKINDLNQAREAELAALPTDRPIQRTMLEKEINRKYDQLIDAIEYDAGIPKQKSMDEMTADERFEVLRDTDPVLAKEMILDDIKELQEKAKELREMPNVSKDAKVENLRQARAYEKEAIRLQSVLAENEDYLITSQAQALYGDYIAEQESAQARQLQPWEEDFLSAKVNQESFERQSDKSHITRSFAQAWFTSGNNAGKRSGNLDMIAQELSELHGLEITEEMLVDFMLRYRNKSVRQTTDKQNEIRREYKALTGESIDNHFAYMESKGFSPAQTESSETDTDEVPFKAASQQTQSAAQAEDVKPVTPGRQKISEVLKDGDKEVTYHQITERASQDLRERMNALKALIDIAPELAIHVNIVNSSEIPTAVQIEEYDRFIEQEYKQLKSKFRQAFAAMSQQEVDATISEFLPDLAGKKLNSIEKGLVAKSFMLELQRKGEVQNLESMLKSAGLTTEEWSYVSNMIGNPAFIYGETVYVISDRITSVSEMKKNIIHEVAAHLGFRRLFVKKDGTDISGIHYKSFDVFWTAFNSMSENEKQSVAKEVLGENYSQYFADGNINQQGKDAFRELFAQSANVGGKNYRNFTELMLDIYDSMPKKDRLRLAQLYYPQYWSNYFDAQGNQIAEISDYMKSYLADEYLAERSESEEQLNWLQKLAHLIRKAFGFTSKQFSNTDIINILNDHRELIRNGLIVPETGAKIDPEDTRFKAQYLDKIDPEAFYRIIGDESGYNDLISSGVVRPNQGGIFKGRSTYFTKGAINDSSNPVNNGGAKKGTYYAGKYLVEVKPNDTYFPTQDHKLNPDWNFGLTKPGNEIPYSSEFLNVYKYNSWKKKYELIPKIEQPSNNSEDVRFKILGEKGAARLDEAEEATKRMDYLRIAKEMEEGIDSSYFFNKIPTELQNDARIINRGEDIDGKSLSRIQANPEAKAAWADYLKALESIEERKSLSPKELKKRIRLATGWEKGADGKWRYERPDIKTVPVPERIKAVSKLMQNIPVDLVEYIDDKELFTAYPGLRWVKLAFDKSMQAGGSYNVFKGEGFGQITVNPDAHKNGDDILKTIAHEIQHAIQRIEGFAEGGNPAMLTKPPKEIIDKMFKILPMDKISDIMKRHNIPGDYDNSNPIVWLKSFLPKIDDFDDRARLNRIIENNASEIYGLWNLNTEYNAYLKLAGEVEARNVESRMGMSEPDRYKTILEETEDVAREDQLILRNGLLSQTPNSIRFKAQEVFYSPTEKAVNDLKQEKGTVSQMKKMILDAGAKEAELDWMGFSDAFPNVNGKVTKQELQDWVLQNKIVIDEVEKKSSIWVKTKDNQWEATIDNQRVSSGRNPKKGKITIIYDGDNYIATDNITNFTQSFKTLLDAKQHFEERDLNTDTRYSDYQTPGGENYKELLLLLPSRIPTYEEYQQMLGYPGNSSMLQQQYLSQFGLKDMMDRTNRQFKSGHWDEPNVIAHIRMNERVVNDENVLFIEEIQSDWAQQGKKKGFKSISDADYAKLDNRRKEIERLGVELKREGKDTPQELKEEWVDIMNKIQPEKRGNLVPDMPFKQTDQWVNLATRRILRHAAENGFDRIAWTNGEMQVGRYALSKQVSEINYNKKVNGDYILTVRDKKNYPFIERITYKENELENVVGREIANKIINGEGEYVHLKGNVLSGLDLKVGGEGMKAFYDSIVPKSFSKIGKKFGATIGQIQIANENVLSIPVTESMVESVLTEDVPMFKAKLKKLAFENYNTLAKSNPESELIFNQSSFTPGVQGNADFKSYGDIQFKSIADKQLNINFDYNQDSDIPDQTFIERIMSSSSNITFMGDKLTGPPAINSPADVAFLFKNLENASTENVFAVAHLPDKSYKVYWVSHGSTTSSVMDIPLTVSFALETGAESITFVHNHPSGNLRPSSQDITMNAKMREALEVQNIKLNDAVIINTDSGYYSVFNDLDFESLAKKVSPEEIIEPDIYQFDKLKFYVPLSERTKISDSHDVAVFLSKTKRGTTPKLGILILDNSNTITKAMIVDETKTIDELTSDISREISKHGRSVILHSNKQIDRSKYLSLHSKLKNLSIQLLDVVIGKQGQDIVDSYTSWADKGDLFEPDQAPRFKAVSENTNLIAIHNIKPGGIINANKIGGLPMPSLAILPAEHGFDSYGDISLIATKDFIDPKKNKQSKVFGSDVYSARYPSITYEIPINSKRAIDDKMSILPKDIQSNIGLNIQNDIESGGLNRLKTSLHAKLFFLLDTGKDFVPIKNESIISEKTLSTFKENGWDKLEYFELSDKPEIRKAISDLYWEEYPASDKKIERMLTEDGYLNSNLLRNFMSDAKRELRENDKINISSSAYAASRFIEDNNLQKEYSDFINSFYNSLNVSEKIFKGFTPQGSRRYVPHTLANVLKEMKQAGIRGGESFSYGAGSVRASVTPEFKSLEQIQKNKDLIQKDIDSIKDQANTDLIDLLDNIKEFYKYDSSSFGYYDNASAELVKLSSRGYSESFKPLDDESRQAVNDYLDKLRNMPTEYFEAKINRGVSLSEFSYAIVPENTEQEIIEILNSNGVEIREYSTSAERTSIINEIAEKDEDIRFKAQTETPEFKAWFGDSKVVNKDGSPKAMYHATNRTFDSFRDDSILYFSDNPEYASMYAMGSSAKGAHYVSQKEKELEARTIAGPNIMPVFIKAENPFDTRIAKHRKIFENEFLNKWGNGTPLDSKLSLPDWTDADDLREFFEDKGYDFDGLILAESHGQITTAVFSPTQIKSATGNIGTFDPGNPDIRFKVAESQQELDDFIKESKVKETLYHGTDTTQITDFEEGRNKHYRQSVNGFWFTDSQANAKMFAGGKTYKDGERRWIDLPEVIYNVKLLIRNPLVIDFKDKSNWIDIVSPDSGIKVMSKETFIRKNGNISMSELMEGINNLRSSQGIDGVIWKNFKDMLPATNYQVFSNDQILIEPKEDIRFKAVYHGSPHSFDKFSMKHIGSGEGVQAYGWGLYFTDKEGIAKSYAGKNNITYKLKGKELQSGSRLSNSISIIFKNIANGMSFIEAKQESINDLKITKSPLDLKAAEILQDVNQSDIEEKQNRNLYKVKIHGDKTIEELNFLRWDKQVPDPIFDKIEAQGNKENNVMLEMIGKDFNRRNQTGRSLYHNISTALNSDKKASLFLLRAGIDGIQYPTEFTTKEEHEESFNYVVFDENAIEIDEHIRFKSKSSHTYFEADDINPETTSSIRTNISDILNNIFKDNNIDIRLEDFSDSDIRFRASQQTRERERRTDKEAYKKAFKTGGEKIYELLYEKQNAAITQFGNKFLSFLSNTIGDKKNAFNIIENNHTWLMLHFQTLYPELFDEGNSVKKFIPNVNDLLNSVGYTIQEHTLSNGKAIGLKGMYRDSFVPDAKTDLNREVDSEYHSKSVICYYNHPESRLSSQFVFTIESHNAKITPTSEELKNDPSLITPEWDAYLDKIGRKNDDGTYDFNGLEPNFNDPFSLSFLMIRIGKDKAHGIETISRYNHSTFNKSGHTISVSGNPNATLGNKLDKIVDGFKESLFASKDISVDKKGVDLSGNVRMANDGRLYVTEKEIDGVYVGDGFYIDRGNTAHILDPSKEALHGIFIVRTDNTIGNILTGQHSNIFQNIHKTQITGNGYKFFFNGEKQSFQKEVKLPDGTIKSVTVDKWVNDNYIEVTLKNGKLTLISDVDFDYKAIENFIISQEKILSIELPNATSIGDSFLIHNKRIQNIDLPNIERIGDNFLFNNNSLQSIKLPKVTSVGDGFLRINERIQNIELPNVESIGNDFLTKNLMLENLILPNVISIGKNFLYGNDNSLQNIELPNVKTIGDRFLFFNTKLRDLRLPNLISVGHNFLYSNKSLKSIELPNIESIGNLFLYSNESLKSIELPKVESIPYDFLSHNVSIKNINLPNVISIKSDFLRNNNSLEKIELPNVKSIENGFLYYNESLKSIELPNVESIRNGFLYSNKSLKSIELPNVRMIKDDFMPFNQSLESINIQNVESIGDYFLVDNKSLQSIELPNLSNIGWGFKNNKSIQRNIEQQLEKNKQPLRFKVQEARKQVDPNPSEAQKAAGNYQKGHIRINGFDISIENPKGSMRSGVDKDGNEWSQEMKADYGYIKGTVGKDKDHIDVFLGDNLDSGKIYVIDQIDPGTKKFDEHKIMMGYDNMNQARKAYLGSYEDGWQGLRDITSVTANELKNWIEDGNTKKPFVESGIRFKIESSDEKTRKMMEDFYALRSAAETAAKKKLKVRESAKESELTSDPDLIESMEYNQLSNKSTVESVRAYISEHGTDRSMLEYFDGTFANDGAFQNAIGIELYRLMNNDGNIVDAFKILDKLAVDGKKAGQEVQYLSVLKRMTPEGQLKYIKRQIDKINEDIRKHNRKSTSQKPLIEISEEEWAEIAKELNGVFEITDIQTLKDFIIRNSGVKGINKQRAIKLINGLDLELEWLRNRAVATILNKVYAKVPESIGMKISTFQAISHLLNPKTFLRNIISNRTMRSAERMSRRLGGAIDLMLHKIMTGEMVIGKATTSDQKKEIAAGAKTKGKETTLDILIEVNKQLSQMDKYRDIATQWSIPSLEEARGKTNTFQSQLFGALEKALTESLVVPDEISKQKVRAEYLAEYENRTGLKPDEEIMQEAEEMASYMTFQNDSWLSTHLTSLKKLLNGIGITNFGMGDLLIKYTRVPGNIITRTFEYSPLGAAKAIIGIGRIAMSKEKTREQQIKVIMGLSRGLTGTALMTLGYLLAKAGMGAGDDDENDEIKKLSAEAGLSGDKLNVSAMIRLATGKDTELQGNDILMNYDWLQPVGSLLKAGSQIARSDNFGQSTLDIAVGFSELPSFMIINKMISEGMYSEADNIAEKAYDVITVPLVEGAGGFVPAPIRQIASITDKTARDTYYSGEDKLTQAGVKVIANIPGLRTYLPPRVRPTGEDKVFSTDNALLDILSTFGPGTLVKYEPFVDTKVLNAIAKFKSDEGTSYVPLRYAPKTLIVDGERYKLTKDEQGFYMRAYGQELLFDYIPEAQSIMLSDIDADSADEYAAELSKYNKAAKDAAKQAVIDNYNRFYDAE